MRNDLIAALEAAKLIVILRGVPRDRLLAVADAVRRGGVRFLEITYRSDGTRDAQTAEDIRLLSEHFAGALHVGAGTVVTEAQAELAKQAGGTFVISPDTNPAVIRKSRALGLVSIPGAYTPTEIFAAHTAGADFVKLFPAENLGPRYVKAVRAPFPQLRLLAVGGVTPETVGDYLRAGVCGFGVGSNIVRGPFVEEGEYDAIADVAAAYVSAVQRRNGQ